MLFCPMLGFAAYCFVDGRVELGFCLLDFLVLVSERDGDCGESLREAWSVVGFGWTGDKCGW